MKLSAFLSVEFIFASTVLIEVTVGNLRKTERTFATTNNPNGLDFYNQEEFTKIASLRSKIKKHVTHEYMLENSYLVKFLRASNGNVQVAETKILQLLKRQAVQNLDNAEKLDFTYWQSRVVFRLFFAKDGRPCVGFPLKDFNPRRYVISGQAEDFFRYFNWGFNTVHRLLPVYQNYTGLEIISIHIIFNVYGINARDHLCLACTTFWLKFVAALEQDNPQIAHSLIIINSPRVMSTIIQIMKPLISDYTRKRLKIYGIDKSEWQSKLLEIFPSNQLTPEFGGLTKPLHWSEAWKFDFDKIVPVHLRKTERQNKTII